LVDEIYNECPDKTGLIDALMEAYAETLSELTDEKEDGGNAVWVVVK
jgi:hypothetical protein